MKGLTKRRIVSLFLALTMIFTALPIGSVGANATEATSIDILYNGQKVDNLTLMEDEKITLTTSVSGSDALSYHWQILVDEESDKWVNIKGYTKDFCVVSYALIGSLLDTDGKAYLRCKATDGANNYLSNTLTVTVSYNVPTTYEKASESSNVSTPVAKQFSLRLANNAVALAAEDEELQSRTIVINYKYEDGTLAFEPFVATIEYGGTFTYTAVSPTVVGYAPYIANTDGTYKEAKEIELSYSALTEDVEINVVYRPVLVNYTVLHYTQNLLDDNYELRTTTTGQQLTGYQVPDCDITIDGFSALYYERLTVAADGSTVVEVYYDRNYYLVDFNLGGGYGVEPIYTRYGATIGVNEPTRAGYVFGGWELVGYNGNEPTEDQKAQYDLNDNKLITVPDANLSYLAIWQQDESSYTVVYWKENADDDGYSFWGSQIVGRNTNGDLDGSVISGDVVSGSDNIPESIHNEEKQYFTYNDARTDKNVIVEGDGSTVVNVYYTRNVYTIQFTGYGTCCLNEHTHTDGTCDSKLICNLEVHTHEATCIATLACTVTAHTHTDVCCTATHVHTTNCYNNVNTNQDVNSNDLVYAPENPVDGQVYRRGYYYNRIIYISGNWYRYSGNNVQSGTIIQPNNNCPGTHTHGDGNCNCSQTAHTHTESCYSYSCGKASHEHLDDCYSDCTKIAHTHGGNCRTNNSNNTIYVITAKYEQTIGDIWPTYDKLKDGEYAYEDNNGNVENNNNQQFRGWDIDGVDAEAVSKRITMTSDLCDTSDGIKNATAQYGATYTYRLYYMFESFDQTSSENGNDRKLYNGIYYDSSSLFYQELMYSSNTTFGQKEITGMDAVGVEKDTTGNGDSLIIYNFLYYNRNRSDLSFQNVNTIVKTVEDIMYEYPIKDVRDSDGNLVSSFEPEYPSTLEPNAYYFAGWYTTPECFDGTKYDFTTATMPNGDLTLYAKWAPVQHKVNVYLDATMQNQIGETQLVDHNDLASAPEETVENGEYRFAGWFYTDNNGEEKAFVFNNMPITHDIDIYAKWSSMVAVKYEVYYKLKDTDTDIAEPTIGSTLAGMNKTFLAKGGTDLYADYQEGYFPETNSHTVTMSAEGENIFTFYYVAVESVPYKVRYIDEATGEELLTTKSVTDNKKAVVTEVFEPISGYMPDAYQKRLVLSANNADENVITFYYTKDDKHAYYRIVHYVENLSGDGYTEYRSIESVGDIDSKYSAEALTISGFEFNQKVTEDSSEFTSLTQTDGGYIVSGTLTADGLLIELFYDRIEVTYTVRYLEYGTNNPLAVDKNGTGIFGEQISETAIDIAGYELVSTPTRTLTLAADSERNVIIFYYQEKNITIQYVPVGSGKVSISSENVLVISGPVNGSTPTPNDGYRFVGWYLDEACTIPVNSSWIDATTNKLTPQKNNGIYEAATYYAKFEAANTDLTIKKEYPDGEDYSIDVNQTFIFDIKGVSGTATADIDLTVTVHGNGEITITDLPIGEYTITEQTDWSWRYEPTDGMNERTITLSPTEENIVTFENTRAETKWLDGDSYDVNIFNGTAN